MYCFGEKIATIQQPSCLRQNLQRLGNWSLLLNLSDGRLQFSSWNVREFRRARGESSSWLRSGLLGINITNSRTSGSDWELGLNESTEWTSLLNQLLHQRSSLSLGSSNTLLDLSSNDLAVLSNSSIDFVLVGLVEWREGEHEDYTGPDQSVDGNEGSDLVQDVSNTGSLQSFLQAVDVNDRSDSLLHGLESVTNDWEGMSSETISVALRGTKVLGDKALAREEVTGVLTSSSSQKSQVGDVEEVGGKIDLDS